MPVSAEDKALRNHPVTSEQLLHAMKAIIESQMETRFLREFEKAFVLASDKDIADLQKFISSHGDPSNLSVQRVGRERC
ncbi:hypothetical protein [Bradyrhizobium archetypum]|uniref:Uncharacterized protein n=1 Tax=Bradyrhizobium archetypum TaxID=2721160 RepID=A0A7Y4H2E2_9BRAD|nr:hypothetical protein [Bradyrhizobium archetypum]NOJ46042.1 hypothetical protein [Bradyrhizobium archetypum]